MSYLSVHTHINTHAYTHTNTNRREEERKEHEILVLNRITRCADFLKLHFIHNYITNFKKSYFIFYQNNRFLSSKLSNLIILVKLAIYYDEKIDIINDNDTMQI